MGNVLRYCWQNMHLAKSKPIVRIENKWKWGARMWRSGTVVRAADNKSPRKWNKWNTANGLSDSSNNINILFHRPVATQCEVVRFVSLAVITLRLLHLILRLSLVRLFFFFSLCATCYPRFFLFSSFSTVPFSLCAFPMVILMFAVPFLLENELRFRMVMFAAFSHFQNWLATERTFYAVKLQKLLKYM